MASYQVRYSVTLRDTIGVKASCVAYLSVRDTVTIADLRTAFQTWVGMIAGVTQGKIVSAGMHIIDQYTAPQPGKPARKARAIDYALISFGLEGLTGTWGFAIPTLDRGVTVRSHYLDIGNAQVAELVQHMTTATADYSYTDQYGRALTGVRHTLLTQRNRRRYNKQLRAKSMTWYEPSPEADESDTEPDESDIEAAEPGTEADEE